MKKKRYFAWAVDLDDFDAYKSFHGTVAKVQLRRFRTATGLTYKQIRELWDAELLCDPEDQRVIRQTGLAFDAAVPGRNLKERVENALAAARTLRYAACLQ